MNRARVYVGAALAIVLVLGMSPSAFAQKRGQKRVKQSKALVKMTQELNLTPDQQAKIDPILKAEQVQVKAVRTDTSLTPKQQTAKVREVRASARTQVESILTNEQRTKWQADQAEQKKEKAKAKPAKKKATATSA